MWKNVLIIVLASLLVATWFHERSSIAVSPKLTEPVVPKEATVPETSPYAGLEQVMTAMQAEDGFTAASLGLAIFADQIVACPAGVVCADFKPGGENNAVHCKVVAIGDNAVWSDFVNAAALCVDQVDIVAIERRQVLIVKAGTFTELSIVRF